MTAPFTGSTTATSYLIGRYGNYIRIPGRHHKRDHWSRFYVAGDWHEGEDAIRLLLDWTSSDAGLNPQSMVHLTEKPVELAVRAMQYSSLAGENVLDLFGGSGSTLIGAEQTGRRALLMELDALYCDVIVRRWEKFTGNRAERHAGAVSVTKESSRAAAGSGVTA